MPMVQCMSLTACCLMDVSDQGSHCFSNCSKGVVTKSHHPCKVTPADIEQYSWELDGIRRKCTCAHCKSTCSKRFCISNFQNIALRLIAKNQHSISEGEETREEETTDYIHCLVSTASNGARAAGCSSDRADAVAGVAADKVEYGGIFAKNASSAAVSLVDSPFSKVIESMQGGFVRNTIVTLLDGQKFDCRSIGRIDKYRTNNRMPDQGRPDLRSAPGMVSLL